VLDRAGVRPIDHNPAEDTAARKLSFDPGLYTPEQLAQIEATLRMVAAAPGGAESGSG